VRREKLDQALSQLRHVENFWKNTFKGLLRGSH
jgi:hypothetical protein